MESKESKLPIAAIELYDDFIHGRLVAAPKIKAATLVHHGELDTRLAATWPAYDQALSAAHVSHEGYIYPGAVHGFNCDATPERYNKAAADLAWQRTIDCPTNTSAADFIPPRL